MPGIDYKKITEKISPVAILFIVLSAITIFIFIFFILIPRQNSIKKIQQDIQSVSNDNKVLNEKFVPAYAIAKKFENIKFEPKFPLPKRDDIDRKNLSELPDKFHTLALEHNLKLSNKNIDLGFLKTKSTSSSMFLELEGKLQDFRNYLIAIISLPFFDSFEKIRINSTRSNLKKFSVDLKINIK
ncbi:MAG: hypothetical protein H8D87_06755 [Deltaproteobacteria bacterium]|uniref:hypothetical protein n=1 Tax=Desulfobacula sp. TaxID=2593537 RepID=UPI00198FE076|nr:hypothetical protein [Candidatus Desulfobacula maris]MBL6994093.1 hypothetical protein [Desulfobacula sp.]